MGAIGVDGARHRGGGGPPAQEVNLARFRYRLDGRDGDLVRPQFQHWMRARLSAMGHRQYVADDPVEMAYWRYTIESGQGYQDTIGEWTTTGLETSRRLLCDLLDTVLVAERGGWPQGSRVRVVGLPTTVRVGRSNRVIDYGDRALVRAPSWAADHDQRTLLPEPPTAYLLAYHVPGTPRPTTSQCSRRRPPSTTWNSTTAPDSRRWPVRPPRQVILRDGRAPGQVQAQLGYFQDGLRVRHPGRSCPAGTSS